jgi:2-oxoglutarate ferredoxin oxidoreductase subunit delta
MAKVSFREDRCKGCGLCVSVCPKKILELDISRLNAKGYHPIICKDQSACIGCTFCAVQCPDSVITVEK